MENLAEKLLKFKFPILIAAISSLAVVFLVYLAPSFVDIVNYFWPLLVSTALFLVTIVVFGRISPSHAEASGEKAAEGILDFVAGEPDNILPPLLDGGYEAKEVAAAAAAAAAALHGQGQGQAASAEGEAEAAVNAKGKGKSDDD